MIALQAQNVVGLTFYRDHPQIVLNELCGTMNEHSYVRITFEQAAQRNLIHSLTQIRFNNPTVTMFFTPQMPTDHPLMLSCTLAATLCEKKQDILSAASVFSAAGNLVWVRQTRYSHPKSGQRGISTILAP